MDDPELQKIMSDAYQSIGESDAIAPFLDPVKSRNAYLQMKNAWNCVFFEHDALFNSLGTQHTTMYTKYLAASGLYCLAGSLAEYSDDQFELAWRLGNYMMYSLSGFRY